MAAKTFDEIFGSLSADEKKLLENTFSKNPELKAGWMAQDDYSRKTQALAVERAADQAKLDHAEKMEAWAEVNVPKYDALVEKGLIGEDGEELWTGQKTELERQLAEAQAKALAGGEMDPAELKRNVEAIAKEYGVMSPAETKALIASEASKLAGETFDTKYAAKEIDFNEKTIPFVAGFSAGNAIAAIEYQTQTGKPWTAETQKEFNALMVKENNFDPFAVKEIFLKPFKQEKETAAEVERLAQARADKIIEERGGLPGAGHEPYIPQNNEGNLKQMMARSAGEGDFESVIAAQAVKAATELRADGK